MSRVEEILQSVLDGRDISVLGEPQSRGEALLMLLTQAIGSGEGGTGIQGPKGDKGDKGDTGATGATGATGNGIASISKTGTNGLVDTYTIVFTNGQSTTFTVTNGIMTLG